MTADVRFGSKADVCSAKGHVRSYPESGHVRCTSLCPLSANSGHSPNELQTSFGGYFEPAIAAVFGLAQTHQLLAANDKTKLIPMF